jgi:hypothetical protein
VSGGILLGYWGTSGGTTAKLYSRYLPTGTTTWNRAVTMSGLTGSGPIAVGADDNAQAVVLFPQLGALYYSTFGGSWGSPYQVGMFTNIPPALTTFQSAMFAVVGASWDLYFTTSPDGIPWTVPTQIPNGAGSDYAAAVTVVDGTTLWVAYTDIGGYVEIMAFDGTTWTGPTSVTGAGASIGAPALVEFNGLVYLAYASGSATSSGIALGTFEGNLILLWQGTNRGASLNGMWNNGTGWTGKETFESVLTTPGLVYFRDPDNRSADQDALWICYRAAGAIGLCRRVLTSST